VPIPHVDVKAQYAPLIPELKAAFAQVLDSGRFIFGPEVEGFEREAAEHLGVEQTIGVANGTDALVLVLDAMGIGAGDEVICPSFTFYATAEAIARAGATPVFADIEPGSLNIDPDEVERRITSRTKAIMPVHLFGRPARVEELPDLPLLEDAAGALGARRKGRACGSLGLVGCQSFHPRKIVTTGEGGAVTTDDDAFAAEVAQLRNHGWRTLAPPDMPAPGLNYRLSDILCAVGLPQARRLDELYAARARVAAGYTERLAHLDVLLPCADDGDLHGWQAYVLQVDDRDRVLAELRAQGIEAQIGTYALNLLGAYADQGAFPGATRVYERALALPFHTRLDDGDLDRVAAALDRLVSHH
jgi:dTDP-4-amino-4,6-dideoxygalactose transaminase